MKMNARTFLLSLNDVYTRIARTEHGVGVVAIRPIPQGTDPFKNCDPFGDVIEIPEAEFEASPAPESVKQMVRDFCALQDGVYFVPNYGIDAIDKSYFVNHSREPNLISIDDGESFIAAYDIEVGEELTADYRKYHNTRSFTP
jgi:hypothetical protein